MYFKRNCQVLVWLLSLNFEGGNAVPMHPEPDMSTGTNVADLVNKNRTSARLANEPVDLTNHELPLPATQSAVPTHTGENTPLHFEKWHQNKNHPERRWVPIVLDPAYVEGERDVIYGALLEISRKTCVDFVQFETEPAQADFVYLLKGTVGCQSAIGRSTLGGKQEIILSPNCVTHRLVLHEMMHTFGFYHQHTLPNRNQFVEVIVKNITPEDQQSNFDEILPYKDRYSFGAPYDYSSVLHYAKTDFAKPGTNTVVPKKHNRVVGVRPLLSFWDTYKLRKLFGCKFTGRKLKLPK